MQTQNVHFFLKDRNPAFPQHYGYDIFVKKKNNNKKTKTKKKRLTLPAILYSGQGLGAWFLITSASAEGCKSAYTVSRFFVFCHLSANCFKVTEVPIEPISISHLVGAVERTFIHNQTVQDPRL